MLTLLICCGIISAMANIKSAEKRIRTIEKKTAQNRSKKSEMNTFIKKYKASPNAELLAKCNSLLDNAAQENIIHKNKAARVKGKLAKMLPATAKA